MKTTLETNSFGISKLEIAFTSMGKRGRIVIEANAEKTFVSVPSFLNDETKERLTRFVDRTIDASSSVEGALEVVRDFLVNRRDIQTAFYSLHALNV